MAVKHGSAPPTTKTDCQPKRVISPAATKPPIAAPSENPQNITVTAVALYAFGADSEVSAIAFGIAPPRPNPVMSRKMKID